MSSTRYQAAGTSLSPAPLGKPLTFPFSATTAPNRFMKAAMSERLATWSPTDPSARGIPTPELIELYRRWGEGGWGVILTGNVMITPANLEATGNPIIPADAPFSGERFSGFQALAAAAGKDGGLVVAQVSHAGRQVGEHINPHPISASDVQLEGVVLGQTYGKPRAATTDDIAAVVEGFAHAAEYLHRAGFHGIELHGAHGYLLAQFLSPTTNKRTDQYGGSLLNRARIIFEIADEIRRRVPAATGFVLGIKINSVEFQAGGLGAEEAAELGQALEEHGFDFVELSGGTYEEMALYHRKESTVAREAFFLEFAELIAPRLEKTKVYVAGGLKTVTGMVKALETVDGVSLGRPAANELDLPRKMLEGKVEGAIRTLLEEMDPRAHQMSGAQFRLVGKGKQPLDFSRQDHTNAFVKSLEGWSKLMGEDTTGKEFGSVDVEGVELLPYGTAYPEA